MSLESFLCIIGFHSSGIKRKVRKGKSELAQFFSFYKSDFFCSVSHLSYRSQTLFHNKGYYHQERSRHNRRTDAESGGVGGKKKQLRNYCIFYERRRGQPFHHSNLKVYNWVILVGRVV